jgi:hypothetical protein
MSKPATQRCELDVAQPTATLPEYRALGFFVASNDDVVYLWREAHGYFERARATDDVQAAERLRRLGTNFAVMAVSLLQEIGRAMQQIDRPARASAQF